MKIEYAIATHPGRVRARNEDRICAHHLVLSQLYVLAVADGMGGHSGGDLSSTIAIETVEKRIGELNAPPKKMMAFLESVMQEANRNVYEAGRRHGLEMGTTLTLGVLAEPILCIAHLGDSRVYCATRKRIEQLTQDHTWATDKEALGAGSMSEADKDAYAGIVTRFVGMSAAPKVAFYKRALVRGETYIFCTDGLHAYVQDAVIHRHARRGRDLDRICQKLIQRANKAGGHDNISVGLLRVS